MDKKEQYLVFLMILLTAVVTVQVFSRGEYYCGWLILQISAAVVFGWFFGRCREKRNWAFFLGGGALLGIWNYALIGLNPPLNDWQLAESSLRRLDFFSTAEIYAILPHAHLHREAIPAAVTVLLLGIYLTVWTARFCAGSTRGTLLRLVLFATLPVVLLPLSLVLICPFLPDKSFLHACFLPPALLTSAGISLVLILVLPVLTALKVRPGRKRLLAARCILILISCGAWGIFFGVQTFRRIRMLDRLAAEGRPMTLDAFYARQKNAKDGTEKISELFEMKKNPEFDTTDLPFNANWNWKARPGTGRNRSRKEEMIRVSESPLGEKFTAGLAALAQYDQIRIGNSYTDFNSFGPVLNNIRSLVRTGTARAAIAHYTGKTELILPRLKAVTPVSRLLRHQPWLICAMVRANLDLIVVSQVVSLGPNGPQYADDYRFFLNRIRGQDYFGAHAWAETEICAELLRGYDRNDRKLIDRLNPTVFFLIRPLLIETAFRYLRMSLRREKYLAEHRDLGKDDPSRWSFRKTAGTKTLMETALALKLYRSLHGHYPRSLTELSPNPATGKGLTYRRLGDGFDISVEDREIKFAIPLSSRPAY